MITELIVVNAMVTLFILGFIWKSSDWVNVFIKVWLVVSSIACFILALKIEGYIIKGLR